MKNSLSIICIAALGLGIVSCKGQSGPHETDSIPKKEKVVEKKDSNSNVQLAPSPYHDLGMHMAGLKIDNPSYAEVQKDPAWQSYSQTFDSLWNHLEKSRLSKQRKWAIKEIHPTSQQTQTLFYPFSGADYLNAGIFFPHAQRIVMIGLEPAGSPPSLSLLQGENGHKYFSSVRKALYSLMQWSFFQTKFMAKDFKSPDLNGTVSLMMIFLVRNGQIIQDVKPAILDTQGNLVEKTFASFKKPDYPAVIVRYHSPGNSQTHELIYFSGDISDGGIDKNAPLKNYIFSLPYESVYLKSASYLMHAENFSWIRSAIIKQAKHVLQDDSGIPFRYFPSDAWEHTLYGMYDKPIKLFSNRFQKDYFTAYQDKSKIKPLPFGIGYDWQESTSNLWFAHRKEIKK